MAHFTGPGQAHRTGISLIAMIEQFPDDKAAEAWFVKVRWPDGIECPKCGSTKVKTDAKHKSMPYLCGVDGCRKKFSVKLGTVMEGSKVGYRNWAVGIHMFLTNIKAISSMKPHRDLGISQKAAWFMLHRMREAFKVQARS